MTLYVAVTADKYELPLAVSDSAKELGELLGRHRAEVYSQMSRKAVSKTKHNGFRYKIIKVEIDEEDEDG